MSDMAAASVRNDVKVRLVRNGWTISLNMTFLEKERTAGRADDAVQIPRTSLVIAVHAVGRR